MIFMSKYNEYEERFDGRDWEETRPIKAEAGVIDKADGSAYFEIGGTAAYAAVYGPRELHPRHKQDPKKGVLRCKYNMLPFAGAGDRVRPGPGRRDKEISMVSEKALLPVVDLEEFPNAVVDVCIELTETDAGSRCAGICAASIALADAGIQMRDQVAAVSFGRVGDKLVVDLDGDEEHFGDNASADIPVAMAPLTEEFTLLQMDGRIEQETFEEGLDMVKDALKEIAEVQRQALKDKYKEIESDAR